MANRFHVTGGYVPPEAHMTVVASKYENAMAGRVVVYCHGAGGNNAIEGADARADLEHHANKGMVCFAGLQGGGTKWGHDDALTAITNALTYVNTSYGADISRVLFVADSHGASNAINWGIRNQSQFAGAVMRVPAFSLQTIHDTDVAGLAAGMEAAYGGLGNLVAAYPTRDACHPTFMASVVSSGMVPKLKVMHNGANDPIINVADINIFAAGTGVETVDMGGPSHAPWGYFSILEQYEWLRSHT